MKKIIKEAILSKDQILVKANKLKSTYNIPNDIFNQLLTNNESNDYVNLLKDIYNLDIVKNNIEKEKSNSKSFINKQNKLTKNLSIKEKLEQLSTLVDSNEFNKIKQYLTKYEIFNNKYVVWILLLIKNKVPRVLEDLEQISKSLKVYDEFKYGQVKKISNELFNNQTFELLIKNKDELFSLVEQYYHLINFGDEVLNDNNLLGNNKYILSGEAIKFYEDSDILIIIPKIHEASRYYGEYSNWCTASEDDTGYNDYTSRGDLYVILFKNEFIDKESKQGKVNKINNKWQFHFEDGQFMDINDKGLNENLLEVFFNKYYEIFLKKNKSYVITISKYLNKENIAKYKLSNVEMVNLFNQAIEKNPNVIKYLTYFKDKLSSNYIISKFKQAIEKNHHVIEYLEYFKDMLSSKYIFNLFKQAIEKNHHVIEYLQYFKDILSSKYIFNLFKQAIEKKPSIIKYLPFFKDILSSGEIFKILEQAIEKDSSNIYYLQYFQDKLSNAHLIILITLYKNIENKINENKLLEKYIRSKVKQLLKY